MRYLPHTPEEIQKMCQDIDVQNIDELFQVIPEALQLKQLLDLEPPLCEIDLLKHMRELNHKNKNLLQVDAFLGAGAYHHYIPVAVNSLVSRGEFLTAYTPYQPEISQGTLQAIFEFQTMVASLTGMELANASNYDGASALAEAALMALRVTKRKKILLAKSIHPQYRHVLKTYLLHQNVEIQEFDWSENGRVTPALIKEYLDDQVAAVCIQSPNFFGIVENLSQLESQVHQAGALLIGCFSEAVSLGMLKSMGDQGADIVVGEGQSFGNSLNLGGPYIGLFATREKFVRQMPGRLVSETIDSEGNRGYVLALATREQHIRREKATSNICTNQGLCALTTAVYLSLMGPKGLARLARQNYDSSHYLQRSLSALPGVELKFASPFFNEFVLQFEMPVKDILFKLKEKNIFGGVMIEQDFPQLKNCLLVCATEMNSKKQMDHYMQALSEILNSEGSL